MNSNDLNITETIKIE